MKKALALLLTAALALGTAAALPAAAAGTVYELERGTVSDVGENTTSVVTMDGASHGRVIDLKADLMPWMASHLSIRTDRERRPAHLELHPRGRPRR
ncbi:MAG: hypothetical protein IKI21_07605 [Oscillospiraceae bacterium]|nr:hypothetical protein [Oscillospiraceae bacterium]